MSSDDPRANELRDAALHEEIELVGDLVVAATSADRRLSQAQIDRLLRVEQGGSRTAPDGGHRRVHAGSAPGCVPLSRYP